jgi:hypothetical protein
VSKRLSRETPGREAVNNELRKSLARCRELLADCRSKLAANEDGEPITAFRRKTEND